MRYTSCVIALCSLSLSSCALIGSSGNPVQKSLTPQPNTCQAMKLKPVWYSAENIVICWGEPAETPKEQTTTSTTRTTTTTVTSGTKAETTRVTTVTNTVAKTTPASEANAVQTPPVILKQNTHDDALGILVGLLGGSAVVMAAVLPLLL